MALGGGIFTSQNKVLPGAYLNFVSAANTEAVLSERGVAAVPLVLNWGTEKAVFEVTAEEFQKNSLEIFGYPYEAPELWPLRELFLHIRKGIFYRLNSGVRAACDYAEARYGGPRGNDLMLVVSASVDDESKYEVTTLVDRREADRQTVASAAELKDNAYVVFKKEAVLAETAGLPLAGGTEGEVVTGADYTEFLAKLEAYQFHVLCCPAADENVKALFAAHTRRMREEAGVKFQTVMYRQAGANYEGIISVENKTAEQEQGLVYWTAGIAAACPVNKSSENREYDGELTVDTDYTQTQLSEGIQAGKFLFHKVGDSVRVLMDINTWTGSTAEKGREFGSNQTLRVLDQIGNDIAAMFNSRYLGNMPNNEAGRISFWNDLVSYMQELEKQRAVEAVEPKEITVAAGETKRSVLVQCPVTPVNCMSQLYMTVVVN